jgi:ABC-type polysaccharide/polyol phosphate transport system, ATPase component
MTSDKIAIHVSHLSKQYKLGGPQEPYHTLRDAIVNSLKAPLNIFHEAPLVEGFWALKDVSFDVEQGEVVGIIGRNGAGKSTLLKILSRITSPTEGTVELHGRVGSLLEVGTGFHPELTGRENIYLSGSILGMKRREIDAKLDEIVKFSEIEKFLDTPVKRYSSGMYVRLAFAVAAHLEPEILLVDEVLAVGDAAFQKKCLGKMGEVAKEGRTVIFVSHNMNAIRNLCTKSIVLMNGKKSFYGNTLKAINYYNSQLSNNLSKSVHFDDIPDKSLIFSRISIFNEKKMDDEYFDLDSNIIIEIEYVVKKDLVGTNLALSIIKDGLNVLWTFDIDCERKLFDLRPKGSYRSRIVLPTGLLGVGVYSVYVDGANYNAEHFAKYPDCLTFKIENNSRDLMDSVNLGGLVGLPLKWNTTKIPE